MSVADPTLAARSRRHRAKAAQREDVVLEAIGAIRGDVQALTAAVMDLAGALRNGVDKNVDASVGPVGKPAQGGRKTRQTVAQREGARARGEGAPPPTGDGAHRSADQVREDAWRIAQVLVVPGSAAAIVDALSVGTTGMTWSLQRVTAGLVQLQAQGQARREPGEGANPDRWVPVHDPDLDLTPPPPRIVAPSPEVHVTCADYQGHATAHRWDPSLGTFVCDLCIVASGRPPHHPNGGGVHVPPP